MLSTWKSRILCRLVWLANTNPPYIGKSEFYDIKSRLVQRYGKHVGHDWQVITKECNRCDGTGIYCYFGDKEPCNRCGGTGVYDRFYVRLDRWEWCGRIFHQPNGRQHTKPEEPVGIQGYVEHVDVGWAANEAVLWLFLVFNRERFMRLMVCGAPAEWVGLYPLCWLNQFTFRIHMAIRRVSKVIQRRTCWDCDRRFWSYKGAIACRRCVKKQHTCI